MSHVFYDLRSPPAEAYCTGSTSAPPSWAELTAITPHLRRRRSSTIVAPVPVPRLEAEVPGSRPPPRRLAFI
eukprot:scaffold31474_cov33-Tisochrysis_lutea.AAC.1